MKVRITKAEKETYWYAKHIGEEFEVFPPLILGQDYHLVDCKDDEGCCIDSRDCKVITEPKPKLREPLTEDPTGDSDMNYSGADNGL